MAFVNKFLEVTTAPAAEPVSVDDFKAFVKLSDTDDDGLITNLLKVARVAAENYTNRAFINTTYKQTQDDFEYDDLGNYSVRDQLAYRVDMQEIEGKQVYIKLERPDVSTVSSINIIDEDNSSSAYAATNYSLYSTANKILINDDATIPTNVRQRGGVEINFVAGYGASSTSVPEDIRYAIMMHTQSIYDYTRNADTLIAAPYTIPESTKQILRPYRLSLGING